MANLLALAIRLQKAGQLGESLAPLHEIARLDPGHALATQQLGSTYLRAQKPAEAARWLRKASELSPTVGETHFELGVALEQMGERASALASYRRAVATAPHLLVAYLRVAELTVALGSPADAATAYEAASARAPHTPMGQIALAKAQLLRGHIDDAERQLRTLATHGTQQGEAHVLLGILLSEAGRFEEARQTFEQALVRSPCDATAHHGLASLARVTERERPLVDRIAACLRNRDLTENARCTLHFAAGKAKDDLGDYAGAMEHFVLANRIRRGLARPFDAQRFEERIRSLIARFTKESFANQEQLACDDERPVLVLGMPRSGTTLVERILAGHPSVAAGGELTFWNANGPRWLDNANGGDTALAAHVTEGYLKELEGVSKAASFVVDKMPFNFLWVGVIHLLFPRARIVHCQRHPIDTCFSIYSTLFSQAWGFASNVTDLAAYYRQYARLMDHWRAVLPTDRFLDVRYEELIASPDAASRRLIAFLGVDWDDACGAPERSAGVVRTASKWQARQPIFRTSVERYRHYEPWLGDLMSLEPISKS